MSQSRPFFKRLIPEEITLRSFQEKIIYDIEDYKWVDEMINDALSKGSWIEELSFSGKDYVFLYTFGDHKLISDVYPDESTRKLYRKIGGHYKLIMKHPNMDDELMIVFN